MQLSRLFNIDENYDAYSELGEKSRLYHQIINVPTGDKAAGTAENPVYYVKLDHIPYDATLTIAGVIVEQSTSKYPPVGKAYIDYRADYDYVEARGIVYFNKAQAGVTYDESQVSYQIVASRVDADHINYLIDFYNYANGEIWLKKDLTGVDTRVEDIIDWECINHRPIAVGPGSAEPGLMTGADKAKLDAMSDPTKVFPISGVMLNHNPEVTVKTDTWGGLLNVETTGTVTALVTTSGALGFSVNTVEIFAPYKTVLDSLLANPSTPTETNYFLTKNDVETYVKRYAATKDHYHNTTEVLGFDKTPYLENGKPDLSKLANADTIPLTKDQSDYLYKQSQSLADDLAHRAWKDHEHSVKDLFDLGDLEETFRGAQGLQGPAGPAGKDGANGINGIDGVDGRDGIYYHPVISEDGILSWTPRNMDADNSVAEIGLPVPEISIIGPAGKDGKDGTVESGCVMSEDIFTTWTYEDDLLYRAEYIEDDGDTPYYRGCYGNGAYYFKGTYIKAENLDDIDVNYSNKYDSKPVLTNTNHFGLWYIAPPQNPTTLVAGDTFTLTISSDTEAGLKARVSYTFKDKTTAAEDINIDEINVKGYRLLPQGNLQLRAGDTFTFTIKNSYQCLDFVTYTTISDNPDKERCKHGYYDEALLKFLQDEYQRKDYIAEEVDAYLLTVVTIDNGNYVDRLDLQRRTPAYAWGNGFTPVLLEIHVDEWTKVKEGRYKYVYSKKGYMPIGLPYKKDGDYWETAFSTVRFHNKFQNIEIIDIAPFEGVLMLGEAD